MTGHADGSGLSGNLHLRNQQIRNYCITNNKVLYDFYDIECYDPDDNYFGDLNVNDDCSYTGGNWAIEWQSAHIEGVDWYNCGAAHTQPLNANLKAYAAWWLWASLAGWDPVTGIVKSQNTNPNEFKLYQNYPNPFNPGTTISYSIQKAGIVTLKVFNILGNEVATLINEQKSAGYHSVDFNAVELPSGVYVYELRSGNFTESKKLILMK
ncbi:MAG: hypothetical protein DRQ13_10045 [Ignavibacteriae bacterium]|nr:MAG: hypothetical protein DRQ13_10045 [Ignavibacteriota bacterium]